MNKIKQYEQKSIGGTITSMLPNTALIVVKYLSPNLISAFLLTHNINLNIKFSYNASHWILSPKKINDIFINFPSIIITGIYLKDNQIDFCKIFDGIKVPIIYNKIKYICYRYKKYIDVSNLIYCTNLRHLRLNSELLYGDPSVFRVCTKMRYLKLIASTDVNFVLESFISNMPQLRCLYIPLNRVTDIHNVAKFKNLRHIVIWGGDFKKITLMLQHLNNKKKQIESLMITNMISATLPDLSCCYGLRKLVIKNCSILNTINIPHTIAKLRTIITIDCENLESIVNLELCPNLQSIQTCNCFKLSMFAGKHVNIVRKVLSYRDTYTELED